MFGEEVTRLIGALDATMQHPCFLGSGREEDDQVGERLGVMSKLGHGWYQGSGVIDATVGGKTNRVM